MILKLLVAVIISLSSSIITCSICGGNRIVIDRDNDLRGEVIELPPNATLIIRGGSLSNGTIVGHNCKLKPKKHKGFFKSDLIIKGTWVNKEYYVDWFSFYHDGVHDDGPTLHNISNMVNDNSGGILCFPKNTPIK